MRKLFSSMLLTLALVAPLVPAVALATPAEAAPMRTWNRLAKCESGGRWHINTRNGYYGGVQISGRTWRAFGGKRFARLPHKASKKQQVKVAERIRKRQGWRAWPACSRRIGVR